MKNKIIRIFAIGLLTVLVPLTVQATPIIGSPTGLTSPGFVISFDELGNLQDTTITNQFQAFGATFQNAWWDNATNGQAGSVGFVGGDLVSGPNPGVVGGGGIVIDFVTAVTEAAVATVDQNGLFDISAYLGAVLVETFQVAISLNPGSGWMGFTGIVFDRMTIMPVGMSALTIDSLQATSVPEPGTLALLGLGLAGMGLARRKKKL